ncbi:MAG: rsmG [Sphingomonas bacterium]|nr:rsmG [Sphingomonas bacterium]
MTEDEAKTWLDVVLGVPRETFALLERFVALLAAENGKQNLIARSTVEQIWSRHLADSAQLLAFCTAPKQWLDLGSGAGFPGLIVALLRPDMNVVLVEERRKRIDFLEQAIDLLGIGARTQVAGGRAETRDLGSFDVISARAFAPIDRLFGIAHRFSKDGTLWLLPKGRSAQAELEAARLTWQGEFRIEPSVTDPDSSILIAGHVRPRKQR